MQVNGVNKIEKKFPLNYCYKYTLIPFTLCKKITSILFRVPDTFFFHPDDAILKLH